MRDVKTLSETIWERRAQGPAVLQWLANFTSTDTRCYKDREMALYLLSRFTFYGSREMRECLKCLYRDLIRYPVVERVRKSLNDSRDIVTVSREASKIMDAMKFLGVGRPSESGPHMLYYFRQENGIRVSQFCDIHELFSIVPCEDSTEATPTFQQEIAGPEATWYIFLDDFSGTGEQAVKKLQMPVKSLKQLCSNAEVCYYSVFATRDALDRIRADTDFDRVESLTFGLDVRLATCTCAPFRRRHKCLASHCIMLRNALGRP